MIYKRLIRPLLFWFEPEKAHRETLTLLRFASDIPPVRAAISRICAVRDERLSQTLFGLRFPNPVGLAAGMDKAGAAPRGFEMLGVGFLEIGGITALPQEGNPKPRMLRLTDDEAIINRMGFPNPGAEETRERLGKTAWPGIPVGVNIGKSKIVPVDDMDAVAADYCHTFAELYEYADFFVINVSSPNTLGLRKLQGKEFLQTLLNQIMGQNWKSPRKEDERAKPVLLKISPDLTFAELDDIIQVVVEVGIDGIVAVNTSTSREGLKTRGNWAAEAGGLSGPPLFSRALSFISHIHKQCPHLPIIGVGGVHSGQDAYDMIGVGANAVQLYTGLVYEGPGLPRRINRELLELMAKDGVGSITDFNPRVNRH